MFPEESHSLPRPSHCVCVMGDYPFFALVFAHRSCAVWMGSRYLSLRILFPRFRWRVSSLLGGCLRLGICILFAVVFSLFLFFIRICFFIHAAVLWLFWLLKNLHESLSLGMVQAAAICPFLPQARQALSPAAAPEWQILVCLNLSEILNVLSIFTIMLWTCSHVEVSVICSCTLMRTDFS